MSPSWSLCHEPQSWALQLYSNSINSRNSIQTQGLKIKDSKQALPWLLSLEGVGLGAEGHLRKMQVHLGWALGVLGTEGHLHCGALGFELFTPSFPVAAHQY